MPDTAVGEHPGKSFVARVGPGVVADQSLRLDSPLGEVGETAFDEAGHGCGFVVTVELAVGVAGVVVDERVHPFVADPQPPLRTGRVTIAGDGVSGPAETNEALAVDVEQIARTGPLVAARLLAWLPRNAGDPLAPKRPPDGGMRVPGLAGDQSRPPTRAASRRADPLLLSGRQQPRRTTRP